MGLKLLLPEPATVAGAGSGAENLVTASPREVWVSPETADRSVFLDLGEARTVDHLFVGAWIGDPATTVQVLRANGPAGAGAVEVAASRPLLLPGAERDRSRHGLVAFPATLSRHWQIRFGTPPAGLTVGRVALALAFEHATSLGGGRLLVDPAPRQAFADGGFGVGEGTVKRIVRWRFEDLVDDEVERLERLGEDRGTSRPLVVVEHRPGGPRALDVHYGLFGTFEATERADPRETRWAMSLEEWR